MRTLPHILTLAACFVGMTSGGAALGLALADDPARPALLPCAWEDATNCYWDARARGNGLGVSFVSLDGQAYHLPEAGPLYRLVLLVNLPDGRQTATDLATLPEAACLPAMRAIWRANADAAPIGFDELGPVPAFDAACMP